MNLLERRNKFYPFNTNIQHDWWWWWECVTLKHVNKENFFYHVHVETLTVFGNDSKIIWWKQQFTNQFPYIQCVWFFFLKRVFFAFDWQFLKCKLTTDDMPLFIFSNRKYIEQKMNWSYWKSMMMLISLSILLILNSFLFSAYRHYYVGFFHFKNLKQMIFFLISNYYHPDLISYFICLNYTNRMIYYYQFECIYIIIIMK